MSRHACASDRTHVSAQNEPDQAQEDPGGELSVVVRVLDKRLHGTAPAHTAAQAMGSRRPGVLCHRVAWQGRRSRKRQASMCSCLAPLVVESEHQQHIVRCLLRININDDRVLLLREVAFQCA